MKEFLGDNIALSQRLEELNGPIQQPAWLSRASNARMREVVSPSQWAICYFTYAAVRCPDPLVRNLLTYGRIVLQLQQRHGGRGWLEYDRAFRLQAASDTSVAWNSLNPSLMASTVLAHAPPPGTTMFCHYCQEADHNPADCALLSADPFLDPPRMRPYSTTMPRARSRPSPYDSSIEVCRRYNRGACPDSGTCKYHHVCSMPDCHQPGHTTQTCPLKAEARPAKAKPST